MAEHPTPWDMDLRPWSAEHAVRLTELLADERDEIARDEPWRPPDYFTVAGQRRRAARIAAKERAGEALTRLIALKGMVVGDVGLELRLPDMDNNEVQLGYWIARPFRRRGVATIASRLMLAEAGRRGFTSVRAHVREDNAASQGVLRQLGFVPEATPQYFTEDVDAFTGEQRPHIRFRRTLLVP
ncbi:MAG: GNAT family N-acetyltransferase [Actinobacteria bacterium]|nr:GNAT family N-acetyltransferase [Actinomycetota bacterium]